MSSPLSGQVHLYDDTTKCYHTLRILAGGGGEMEIPTSMKADLLSVKSLLLSYRATIEETQLRAQVPRGKQDNDMQLRLMLHLAVRSGNITFSHTR